MSLASNVTDLATRVGTELKTHKTLINGNATDLAALTTTAKGNLVAAINEVDAAVDDLADAVGSASGIDDTGTSTATAWSSQHTSDQIGTASTADRARANHTGTQSMDTITESATGKILSAAERTKLTGIATSATANQADSYLLDRSHHTGTQAASTITGLPAALIDDGAVTDTDLTWSANQIGVAIAGVKSELIGGAGPDYDSLKELADLLTADPGGLAAINTALGLRVRVDASQTFDSTQQGQARTNIGAASAADVGDASTNFVTAFESAIA